MVRGGWWWREAEDEPADEPADEEAALRYELGFLIIIVRFLELARRTGSGRDISLEGVMTAVGESVFWPGAMD